MDKLANEETLPVEVTLIPQRSATFGGPVSRFRSTCRLAAVIVPAALFLLPARAQARSFFSSHEEVVNFGFFIGITFGTKVSFSTGADTRFGRLGPTPFARVEVRSAGSFRFTVGATGVKRGSYGAPAPVGELGWSVMTPSSERHVGWSSGLHLGAGVGGLSVQGLGQGMIPLIGDRRNWAASLSLITVLPEAFEHIVLSE